METKREQADKILRDLFARQQRISIAEAVEAGEQHDVSRRTLLRAAKDMGVQSVPNGPFGAFWEIPS